MKLRRSSAPTVKPPRLRRGWFDDRSQVERLEDRVLLAAEPMLQVSRPDPDEPLSSANVVVEALGRQSVSRSVADVLAVIGMPQEGTLVEQNGTALFPRDFGCAPVAAGDRFELVRIAAGG